MIAQRFGGEWTERKLSKLEEYLKQYLRIFTANEKAAKFTRHYVDAFAGSGTREIATGAADILGAPEPDLFQDVIEAVKYMDGSVRKVLGLEKDFHHYWFVEKNRVHASSLSRMIREDFPERSLRCRVIVDDANDFLGKWCAGLRPMDRAVVFLDPYGMAVDWDTVVRIGHTRKVDLWMLFPCSGVIRMLPRKGEPDDAWAKRLTSLFGTEDWRAEFYPKSRQADLFANADARERRVDAESVAEFLIGRLNGIFSAVIERPVILYNSRGSPLFFLVFAAGNPRGAVTAVKIAQHLVVRS